MFYYSKWIIQTWLQIKLLLCINKYDNISAINRKQPLYNVQGEFCKLKDVVLPKPCTFHCSYCFSYLGHSLNLWWSISQKLLFCSWSTLNYDMGQALCSSHSHISIRHSILLECLWNMLYAQTLLNGTITN